MDTVYQYETHNILCGQLLVNPLVSVTSMAFPSLALRPLVNRAIEEGEEITSYNKIPYSPET